MNKNYGVWIALISSTLLGACNTVPTRRQHSAASIPRFVDVNNSNFTGNESGGVGVSGGAGYGLAWSDVGNVHGSQIYHVGVNYRNPTFAFGWTPFLGEAQVSHEGTGVFGSVLWMAFHFGGGNKWRFSYQNTYGVSNKTSESKGCENDVGFLFSSCTGSPTSSSRSEVKVKEVGIIFTADRRVHAKNSIVIAPALYWTAISSGNKLDVDPSGDYMLRTHFWSPGLQLGYVMRFGEEINSLLTIMLGAQWVKTFRPDRAEREVLPTADLRFQF